MRTSSTKTTLDSKVKKFLFSFLAIAVLSSGFYFARKSGTNPQVYSNDFNVYYHAAREILEGHSPYRDSLGEWTPYLYPPLTAEALIPLALVPLPVAAYVWFVISAAAVIASIWMLAALTDDHLATNLLTTTQFGFAALAVVVVFRFVLDTFSLGQINTVVTALSIAHVFFLCRQKKGLSAIALILAVSIKLTPAVLLIYHIAKLRLKFAAACIALLVVVTFGSFMPFGLSATEFQIFVNRTIRNEQGFNLADSGNQSLRGAIERSINDHSSSTSIDSNSSRSPSDPTSFILSIVFIALSILAAVRAGSELAGIAPFFCCAVLLSPLSWKAHFVMLMLPISVLLFQARNFPKWRFAITAALLFVFAMFNLTSPRIVGLAAAEWCDYHSMIFVGATIILACCVFHATERKFGKQPAVC